MSKCPEKASDGQFLLAAEDTEEGSVSISQRVSFYQRRVRRRRPRVSLCLAPRTQKEVQFLLVRWSVSVSAEDAEVVRGLFYVGRRGRRKGVSFYWSDGQFLLALRTPKASDGQFLLGAEDTEGGSVRISQRQFLLRRGRRRRSRVSLFFSSSLFYIQVYFKQSGLFFFVQVYFFELTKRDQGSNNPYPSCTQRLAPRSGA